MAIGDRQIDLSNAQYYPSPSPSSLGRQGGLSPRVINSLYQWEVNPAASATNNLFTSVSVFSSSVINSTVAPGTQIDYARNLNYRLLPSTASSSLYSGTLVAVGSDLYGRSTSESVAMTALNTISQGISGSVCFASVGTISFSQCSLNSNSSSASSAMTVQVGQGQLLGLPASVQSTNVVQWAYIGTSRQTTTSATSATSNNLWTVSTGDVGKAGIAFSTQYTSQSTVNLSIWATR